MLNDGMQVGDNAEAKSQSVSCLLLALMLHATTRAFERYLQVSLKGHPRAGYGPSVCLVCFIGNGWGPDALDSPELIIPRLTPEECTRAEVLIDDDKG